ncbi:hypothetical protein RD792_007247 [Penstemon davidsonii]|uniref:non-specific serine/threonine protein kinase n=1 Tax=Penstemon davidsonii TaxID=160366 RepID=A0ABR0D7P2_9LAMI|nr:hypothetical protein RD792_007247 [Penstemon davidsonii]
MQGTSMEGPIPDAISQLRNLTELRISDLSGPRMSFPSLQNTRDNLEQLVLRNCSINEPIPVYLGDMANLTTLDLSYNNFTRSRVVDDCQFPNINLVSSYSSSAGNSQTSLALETPTVRASIDIFNRKLSFVLTKYTLLITLTDHSFFINCGGVRRINFEDNEYDENSSDQVPSHFESNDRWASSSTGIYPGSSEAGFAATNVTTMISTGGEIYRTARLSPSSLKYYGLCLRRGNYRVRLHFAEIMFTRGSSFGSLGRRVFDVAIQGEVVLRDFDIAKEANGVGIGIYHDFNVLVNGSTLEIHLYWTGKGTVALPERSLYGPLISAIAVTPNFDVSTGPSIGTIIGSVVSSCVVVLLILVVLWKKGCFGRKDVEDKDLRALDLQTGYFTLRQIKAATNNFDKANKIGEGGFGPVYKGVLPDGTIIAVKQLSSRSKQGNREFVNEIGMVSALQHPNLVKLFGCCIEGNQLLLIYEYMENNSLARALFGTEEQKLNLNWPTRKKICLGIAKGLAFLHEESRLKIVHRDIKATNILLDKDLNAKISDFGLAKLDEEENTHISTRIAGTIGYMAPEYAMRGYLTDKADVYSFGIVALEIVSGKNNTNYRPKEEFVYLLDWCTSLELVLHILTLDFVPLSFGQNVKAYVLQEQGNLLELVDPILGSNYLKEEAMLMLNLSLLCANISPTLRPSMSSVVSMLNGKTPVQAPIVKRGAVNTMINEDIRSKAFEILDLAGQDSQTQIGEHRDVSGDGPWIDSSFSLSSKEEIHDQSKDECHDSGSFYSMASQLLPDLYKSSRSL